MGFFFRKSIKLGLFRLNFSKSGIGASVGVKGARAGINAKGQKYVSAGRYGIGYRKVFSRTKPSKSVDPINTPAAIRLSAVSINQLKLLLLKADFVDLHQKGCDAAKYLEIYSSMIVQAKDLCATLPPDGVEALLLDLIISRYEYGQGLATGLANLPPHGTKEHRNALLLLGRQFRFGSDPERKVEESLDRARLAKSLLLGHLEGTLTEDQQQILSSLYAHKFGLTDGMTRPESGISKGTKVFLGIVLLLSCSIISRCMNAFQKPSQPSGPSQFVIAPAATITPSPTPKIKKARKQ